MWSEHQHRALLILKNFKKKKKKKKKQLQNRSQLARCILKRKNNEVICGVEITTANDTREGSLQQKQHRQKWEYELTTWYEVEFADVLQIKTRLLQFYKEEERKDINNTEHVEHVDQEWLTQELNVSYLHRLVHIICACQRIYEYDC